MLMLGVIGYIGLLRICPSKARRCESLLAEIWLGSGGKRAGVTVLFAGIATARPARSGVVATSARWVATSLPFYDPARGVRVAGLFDDLPRVFLDRQSGEKSSIAVKKGSSRPSHHRPAL